MKNPDITNYNEIKRPKLTRNKSKQQTTEKKVCDLTSGDVGKTEKQIRYWVPSLKLKFNSKNIITSGQWLSDIHTHSAQKIMKEQFGHIIGFQDTVLAPTFDDKSQTWT